MHKMLFSLLTTFHILDHNHKRDKQNRHMTPAVVRTILGAHYKWISATSCERPLRGVIILFCRR